MFSCCRYFRQPKTVDNIVSEAKKHVKLYIYRQWHMEHSSCSSQLKPKQVLAFKIIIIKNYNKERILMTYIRKIPSGYSYTII